MRSRNILKDDLMRLGSPVEALAAAVHHAALVALPELQYETRDWDSPDRDARKPMVRRPEPDECEVFAMFVQSWGSTALGFGGLGGAAITPAYTVVIQGPARDFAVYWHGRFAYLVPAESAGRAQFLEDVAARRTANCRNAVTRYALQPQAA